MSTILPRGNMEATLLHLIFNIAPPLLTHIVQYFSQHPFQRIVLHHPAFLTRRLDCLVTIIADVEGGAVEMTAVLGGVSVIVPQFRHIFLCAEDTRHDELMQGDTLDLQTVVIGSSYIAEQYGSSGNQIRNTSVQYIHMIIR